MASKSNRCWPGYEPVPGKRPNEQGSCRPKAKSKLTAKGRKVRSARRRQLDRWEKAHEGKKRQSARHLEAPKAVPKSQRGSWARRKKTATRKTTAGKSRRASSSGLSRAKSPRRSSPTGGTRRSGSRAPKGGARK
ncbi:MAG TPA: hypothetical protein VK447_14500 [Myxococcaceae bacterium]|nr:hypothetical protein [Myxococcaceae bacterium]